MDTLFWAQCSPNITVEHTSKKYYNKYLYKIVVYCPAGRLIDSKGPMDQELENRKGIYKHISSSFIQTGWWGHRHSRDLVHADISLLDTLRTIRKTAINIKLRVEEPRIQIYAENEEDLMKLVTDYLQPYSKNIEAFAGPMDESAAEILNSGAIIRRTNNGYSHKVILRDGRYGADIKETILKYLEDLQIETVGIPRSCRAMFTKSSSYVWNCYFYTNDPSVTIFLNLIQPGLVSNCHELVIA